MERKGKIIALFIANALFVLATIGLIILASMNWGKGKKKDYDMSGVVFDDLTVEYDGQPHSILATNLPEGVSVSYDNNDQTEIGTYTVTAHFYGDEERYNPIPDKTATLTVSKPAKSRILSATGFEIDETSEPPRISCDVSNTTEQIDLSDKITVMPNRTWKLYEDINGDNELTTKSMSLEIGHNIAYIIITDLINNTATYEVDVYRLDMKSYTFKNEGQIHASGEIEEKSQLESPAIPEKTYYTFTGWAVEGSTDIVQFPYTVTEDITFVAQYKPVNFVITYYLDGGQNDEGNPEYYSIETPDIELMPATREYYDFGGWFEDGQFGTEVTVIECGSHGDKNLYAKWTPIEYKINYYPNGGENDGRNPEYYNVETPDIELLPATREYYDFGGWFEDEQFGTEVTVIECGSHGEMNLYAKWTLTEYAINYHLNGGINNEGNPEYYNIETPDIELLPATRDGYVFEGWYSDGQFGTEVTVIEHGSSGEKELYAKWAYGSEGLIYEQIGSEYKVIGYNGNAAEIIVPEEWKGLPVTAIDKGVFANCTNLEKLTIPFIGATKDGKENTHFGYIFGAEKYDENTDFVPTSLKTVIITGGTFIDEYAFWYCVSLTSITLPDSVKRIATYAFNHCENLDSITIPDKVTSISYGTFQSCKGLKSVTFSEQSKLTTIDSHAFWFCESLTNITIPDSVTQIGGCAFGYCESLTNITIPDGVTSIGLGAFVYCTSLTSIIIPDSVTSIGKEAFCVCTSLTSIEIPASVISIGKGAFERCTSLEEITIPFVGATKDGDTDTHFGYIFGAEKYDKNTDFVPTSLKSVIITGGSTIDYGAFMYCASLESISIPESVTKVGNFAFEYCTNLTSVEFGENSQLASISCGMFERCSSLKSIKVPDSVTYINDNAFEYCTSLESVTFGENSQLNYIGELVFDACTNLKSIKIPDGVLYLGGYAFGLCTSLESVIFGEKSQLKYIDCWAFSDCSSLKSIQIPDSVTLIDMYAFDGCTSLEEITLPFVGGSADGKTATHFGYIFGAPSYTDNAKYVPISLKTVTITGGTTIGEEAFYQCTSLESIEIPASVNKIGAIAFSGCTALTAVYVTDIASWCNIYFVSNSANPLFYAHNLYLNNELVTTLEIPASVTKISSFAFWGCTSITSVVFGEDSKLNTIGTDAFSGCTNLKSITIPAAVTSIRYEAFRGCASLESVIFKNTSGWTADGINISSEDLENPATAAKYLKDTYCLMYWKRS